ncbi:cathepsin B-like [Ornithodoros turicata]|uniref:cathepsin B-like n=1 Tax=Ornithodoros turicata TaxID=34597 RepID=UPI003138B4FA
MLKFAVTLSALVAVAWSRAVAPDDLHPTSDEMIDFINNLNTTWKAGRNFDESLDLEYFRGLMGVQPMSLPYRFPTIEHDVNPDVLPESFDAREKWGFCYSVIAVIGDTGSCASSWAVGAAGVISDRTCIHTDSALNVNISAEDIMECADTFCGAGCRGGLPGCAWWSWQHRGIVSGGLYGTKDGCKPYAIPPCEHVGKGKRPPCTAPKKAPECLTKCRDGYKTKYGEDIYTAKTTYDVPNDEHQIMAEIYKNGPVQADFTVYSDFLNYKSGVYQEQTGQPLGLLVVKILGWGKDNGVPYWLVANSWNTDWGENGYFRILRGGNECGIEGDVIAGIPWYQ